jgi:hypothetical protein
LLAFGWRILIVYNRLSFSILGDGCRSSIVVDGGVRSVLFQSSSRCMPRSCCLQPASHHCLKLSSYVIFFGSLCSASIVIVAVVTLASGSICRGQILLPASPHVIEWALLESCGRIRRRVALMLAHARCNCTVRAAAASLAFRIMRLIRKQVTTFGAFDGV